MRVWQRNLTNLKTVGVARYDMTRMLSSRLEPHYLLISSIQYDNIRLHMSNQAICVVFGTHANQNPRDRALPFLDGALSSPWLGKCVSQPLCFGLSMFNG
jgi:hypothetical protein